MSNRIVTRLLMLVCASACASSGARKSSLPAAEGRVRSDTVVVRVANRADRPFTISLAHGTTTATLGDVTANGQARFALRAADVTSGRVALIATKGGESTRTAPFRARGGQVVWFDITPTLVGSKVYLRWPEEGPPKPPSGGA